MLRMSELAKTSRDKKKQEGKQNKTVKLKGVWHNQVLRVGEQLALDSSDHIKQNVLFVVASDGIP